MPVINTEIIKYESKSTAAADGEAGGNGLGGYRSSDAITTNVVENCFDNITAAESESGDTEYRAVFVKNTNGSLTAYSMNVWILSETPSTTLTSELAAGGSETTVSVSNNSDFPSTGAFFIESEEFTYTGKSGSTQFTGVTRGSNSTTKAQHLVGVYCEHNKMTIAVEEPSNKSTGYIQSIASESASPTGRSFAAPRTRGTATSIGNLAPGEFYGIWIKRQVPVGCQAKSNISLELQFECATAE